MLDKQFFNEIQTIIFSLDKLQTFSREHIFLTEYEFQDFLYSFFKYMQ